jgi:hypothetical protein
MAKGWVSKELRGFRQEKEMRNISRRIDTIEKKLSLGQHEKQIVFLPPILSLAPRNSTGKDTEKLGPTKTWITYQEQLHTQQKANAEFLKDNPNCLGAPIVIDLDVEKEYLAIYD